MHAIDDNGHGVIDQTMGTAVGNGRVCLIKVIQYVSIAFNADTFRLRIFPVEAGADFLPCGCG